MKAARVANGRFILLVVFSLLALLTRYYFLENKPLHFDEGINAWFVLQMEKTGFYQYSPLNYHGPLYFYLLKTWTGIWGHSIFSIRSLPTTFSFLTLIFFYWRLPAMAWLMLFSPAFVFYSRSGIHESTFVFFQILFFWGLWSFHQRQRLISLWSVGLGILGMISLKETFAITGFSALIAMLISRYPWRALLRSLPAMKYPILFFLFAWALLFSGFGHNLEGLKDFFLAVTPWLKTGTEGNGHEKFFGYWLQMAYQTEPLLLLALGLTVFGLFSPWRMVAVFALLNGLIYSWVSYKTPWCLISIAWPFYFCASLAISQAWSQGRRSLKFTLMAALALGIAFQMQQLWTAVYRDPIDLNHPLVYVNSTYEFKKLNDKIMRDLEQSSARRDEIIQISLSESWPLPWSLHKSHGLRYDHIRKNFIPGAWIYFCDASDEDFLRSQLGESQRNYRHVNLQMRQSTPPISVWWRVDPFSSEPEEFK